MRTTPLGRAATAGALAALAALTAGCSSSSAPTTTPTSSAGGGAVTTSAAAPADNGIGELPFNVVVTRAFNSLKTAHSLKVAADVGSGADKISVHVQVKGTQGAVGTVGLGATTMGFLRIGAVTYLHADAANWRRFGADQATAATLDGKYVRMPANDQQLVPLTTYTTLSGLASLFDPAGAPSASMRWPQASVNGQRTVRLGELKDGAIFVALTGTPYPVRLQATDPKSPVLLDLTDFNQPIALTTPPAADVITLPAS